MKSAYILENLDTELHLKILTNILPEMKSIIDKNILIKMDMQEPIGRLTH